MSDFGDFDPDDALDTEPPDLEQVARKLHRYRQDDEPGVPAWEALSQPERTMLLARVMRLLAWLQRQGGLR